MEEEILKKEYEWAWKSLKETIASLEEYKNENRWDDYIKVVEEKEKLLTDNISQPLKQKIELLKIEKNQTWKNVLSRIFTLGFYNRKKQISKKIDKLEEAIFTVNEKWKNEVDIINSMKNRLENEFKSENNRLKSDNEKMKNECKNIQTENEKNKAKLNELEKINKKNAKEIEELKSENQEYIKIQEKNNEEKISMKITFDNVSRGLKEEIEFYKGNSVSLEQQLPDSGIDLCAEEVVEVKVDIFNANKINCNNFDNNNNKTTSKINFISF